MKLCPGCHQEKPLTAFYTRGSGRRSDSRCKPCKYTEMVNRPESATIAKRLWAKVVKDGENGCWTWTGATNDSGYGMMWTGGHPYLKVVHRVSLKLAGIDVPDDMHIDHICRNRLCVNPKHLRVVTPMTNALENNLSPIAALARRTTCKQGHPWTPENTRMMPAKLRKNRHGNMKMSKPTRQCLTCYRERRPGTKL